MENHSSDIGLIGVVQIVLIILKLFKLINWSWWAVLIPLWIDIGLAIILIIAYVVAVRSPNTRDIDDFFNYKR